MKAAEIFEGENSWWSRGKSHGKWMEDTPGIHLVGDNFWLSRDIPEVDVAGIIWWDLRLKDVLFGMICSWCSCLFARDFFDFLIGFRWIDEDCQLRFSGLTWILARLKWDFNQQELVFFHTNPTENAHFSGRSDVSRQGLRSTTAGQQPGAKRQVWVGGCLGEIWIWKLRKLGGE